MRVEAMAAKVSYLETRRRLRPDSQSPSCAQPWKRVFTARSTQCCSLFGQTRRYRLLDIGQPVPVMAPSESYRVASAILV